MAVQTRVKITLVVNGNRKSTMAVTSDANAYFVTLLHGKVVFIIRRTIKS